MERIIERRREERLRVVELVKEFCKEVEKIFNKFTLILIGSYARGDFNLWSDIDVLIVVESCPRNPLRRFDLIKEVMMNPKFSNIEPIILTIEEIELKVRKKDPLIREVVDYGVFIRDDLNIRDLLKLKLSGDS